MALPSGYTQLEYIQSTGKQYINTEVNPTQSTKIELVVSGWSNAESNTSIFGVSPNTGGRYEVGTTGTGGYRSYYNGSSRSFGTSADAEIKTTILRDGRITSIGGVTVTHTEATFTCDLPLFLFARNNVGTATGYATAAIYSYKIHDNGTLIRDYIPCKNDSGEVGLYDLVNSKFYANAGSGTFTAGPEVETNPMAPHDGHNSRISGTAREIESGTVLIGGVLREIESGLVLVNGVAREIAFGSAKAKVSQLSVGDIVRVPVNGIQKEFIVVHQGIPSSLYDSSCDGTWLLMKDCVSNQVWPSGSSTNYSKSNAHTYLANTFMGMLSSGVKSKIKTVKIPYFGASVQTGSNGLSTQSFLLSARELGFDGGTYMPKEGVTLSYFNGASNSDKIAYLNGTAVKWHTRTPWTRYSNPYSYYVTTSGSYDYDVNASMGMRPAFILDPETQYDPNTMEILY